MSFLALPLQSRNIKCKLREYADRIIDSYYHNCAAWDWRVEYVYETGDKKYQHISIPVPKDNTYLILVLSLNTKKFIGYHILDMNEKYGLNEI